MTTPASDTFAVDTDGPDATRLLSEELGAVCQGGEILLLSGDLGAGKTCFVQGLARGLGVSPDLSVTSPTFVLYNQYAGRLRLDHVDLYRLATDDDAPDAPRTRPPLAASRDALDGIGLADWWGASDGVCAVEWPEVFGEHRPPGGLWVGLSPTDDGTGRRIQFRALDAAHEALMKRLRARLASEASPGDAALDG